MAHNKIVAFLASMIVVLVLLLVLFGVINLFPTASAQSNNLVDCCIEWKDKPYNCKTQYYSEVCSGQLPTLCEQEYPGIDENGDGINDHCLKMCAENDCNPLIIGGE